MAEGIVEPLRRGRSGHRNRVRPRNRATEGPRPYASDEPRLVESKLGPPPVASNVLARPRLVALLDEAVAGGLTVVSGPAGTGKSVLLAAWARARPGVAWVSVDEFDRDPIRLWAHVGAALRRSLWGAAPDRRSGPPRDGARVSVEDVVVLADRLTAPTVLVVDGLDRLGPGAAAASFASLVACRPPLLRLVVGARTVESLPLNPLRLGEIGPDELAFTPAEVRQLWLRRGRGLTAQAADELVMATDGWAASVARMDESIQDSGDDFVRTEVVDRLPRDLHELLVRLSLLVEVTPELAGALADEAGAPALLDQAHRAGYLVPSGPGEWYRLRRPLRDVLRRQGRLGYGRQRLAWHVRAARWLADHGQPAAALHHAEQAEDWPLVQEVLLRFAAPLLLGSHSREVASGLPIVDAYDDARRATALAVLAAGRDDRPAVRAFRDLAEPGLAALGTADALRLRAVLALCAVVAARADEDVAAMATTARALIHAVDAAVPGLVPHVAHLRGAADESAGTAALWTGDLTEAERRLRAARTASDHSGPTSVVARAAGGLAMLHCVRGAQAAAVELARTVPDEPLASLVLDLDRVLRDEPHPRRAETTPAAEDERPSTLARTAVRARILSHHGERAAARDLLATVSAALARMGEAAPRLLADWVVLAEAELHLAEARPVHALTALSGVGHGPEAPLGGPARVMTARAYLASAAPARAVSLLAPVPGWADLGPVVRVEAWLAEALAADALGHDGAVAIALADAVALATAEGLTQPFRRAGFLGTGPELRDVLERHRDLIEPDLRYTGEPTAPRTRWSVPIVEPITPREAVVLRYLPTLLALTDIARELSVSPNTVKSHLRHIYRKLSVGNRRDAVRQARRLGLLTDGPAN